MQSLIPLCHLQAERDLTGWSAVGQQGPLRRNKIKWACFKQTGEKLWLSGCVISIARGRWPGLLCWKSPWLIQTPLLLVLNGQALCLLAEGTGGLEVLNFKITFCMTFIIAVLYPVNPIPGTQTRGSIKGQPDPREQSQDATKKALGRGELLFLKGWQNTALCFTNHLSHLEFTAGLISVSSWGLTFSRSS